ncbi:MAG TPA: Ig-like domain-containing protein [Terriglobales bacterium]|nr:Ig-like domain-containing protein [Terriglobales bacterium]
MSEPITVSGDYPIAAFDTQAAVPNTPGYFPTGSQMTFSLWMQASNGSGVVYPEAKLYINNPFGVLLCNARASTQLTTVLKLFNFSCTTAANIGMQATDRLYLWVGAAQTGRGVPALTAALNIEGTLNGNYDSQIVVRTPLLPSINSNGLSPNIGTVNSSVIIQGSNFGNGGQGSVTFNGTTATTTTWSNNSITATVPAGATSGNVVVTVAGIASNGVNLPILTSLAISPRNPVVPNGTPKQFTVTGTYTGGSTQDLTNTVNWTSSSTTVATINSSGLATTIAQGSTTIRAALGSVSDSTALTVGSPTLASVAVTPASPVATRGATRQFTATGTYTDGSTQNLTSTVTWTSSAPAIATINSSGLATAVAQGSSTITATSGSLSNSTPLTVTASAPVTIAVAPGNTTVTAGATQQYTATGTYPDNSTQNLTSTASWTSSAPAVISINSAGLSTALSAGSAMITASAAGVNGSTNVTVGAGAVNYIYDDLGRLVGVVAQNGNAATYNYDPVGNILSITRQAPNQVSIMQFSPTSGLAGTTVTISGTGFITTPAQNTVKFNGITATVTAATANQLVVTVPGTATTGPVTVSNVFGTATAALNFSVSTNAPSITDFSPHVGLPGAALTITGTNFNPDANKNHIRINIAQQQPVTSASATSLGATLAQGTTSGHVFVSTPLGKTVSSADFFVPFNNHTVASVGYTGRLDYVHNSQLVTFSAPNQIGILLFDAHGGDKVQLQTNNSTIASATISVFAPNGSTVASGSFSTGTQTYDGIVLPAKMDGTYTIGIEPGSNTGNANVSLINESDVTATISIDGPAVTTTTTIPGQDARLYFNNIQASERIVLYVSNVTNPSATVYLVNPDGTQHGFGLGINNSPAGQTFFMDTQTLASIGTYQLWVQHTASMASTSIGSETLQLVSVPPDVTATLNVPSSPGTGPATTVTTPAVGQNANLTFACAAGQKLSFNVSNSTYSNSNGGCGITIYEPNNNSEALACPATGASGFIDTITIPITGTCSIFIDPQGTNTGSLTVSANNDADVTASISIDGPPVTVTTTVNGQDAYLSFTTSTANQPVVLNVGNVTTPSAEVRLVKPDGLEQWFVDINNNPAGQNFLLDRQTLAAVGNYKLWIPHSANLTGDIGSETLQLYSSPSTTINGASVNVPASGSLAAGQTAEAVFSGSTGQSVTVHVANNTLSNVQVGLYDPNNTLLTSTSGTTSTFSLSSVTLGATGTYVIKVTSQGSATGSMTVNVTNP